MLPLFHKSLAALLLLTLPAVAQAQFNYVTNAGSISITGYTGPGGGVIIPTNINGLPVTVISPHAFQDVTNMTIIAIPESVTNIGSGAFELCTSLASVRIPNGVSLISDSVFLGAGLTGITIPPNVTSISERAFFECSKLPAVTIPTNVTNIDNQAFAACSNLFAIMVDSNNNYFSSLDGVLFDKNQRTLLQYPARKSGNNYTIPAGVTSVGIQVFEGCTNLISITVPGSVTNLDLFAFDSCPNLTDIYFAGNAPSVQGGVLVVDTNTTVYYLPGNLGWGTPLGGAPTSPWFLPYPTILNNGPGFGVSSNAFGFTISWATNVPVVVQAATNLANPIWVPVATNTLTNGSCHFSDPQWTNYSGRFYRVGTP
jgi:BspA type Leucine rich repeat region (6 copies)